MELKKITLLILFMLCMGLMLGACSESNFNSVDDSVFQQCLDVRPEVTCKVVCNDGVCIDQYDYTIQTDAQVKDILFVVDASGSMSEEQARMGSMFPNFLNILSEVDYRIAITTTDVRTSVNIRQNTNLPDRNNGFGDFQDGNLLPFNDGSSYLDGSLPLLTEQRFFEETIQREETLVCERNNYDEASCPSGDERGILAAYMTMESNPDNFIRPVGHMAVVILSDEDEGSNGSLVDQVEDPNTFIDEFKNLYPNKSITVHSVIVQPDDVACFRQQDRPGHPPGQYGNVYAELTDLTVGGIQGDICADNGNYTTQLQDIGESVAQVRETLPCSPIGGDVQVDLIPEPDYPVEVIKNLSQNEILFSEPLPEGTQIRFRFECDNN